MAFEKISNPSNGDFTPAKYVRYTHPEDRELTEKELLLKKGDSVTGYYVRSYLKASNFGEKYNHVLCTEENTHIVIPDNADVTKDFLKPTMVSGALTRFTYLGKEAFKTKTGQSAKAVRALIEQDKDQVVTFEGGDGCEVIAGSTTDTVVKQAPANDLTTESVPF